MAIGRLDGRDVIVSGSGDRTVRIWRMGDGEDRVVIGHEGWVTAVAIGVLGGREVIVSGSDDGTVRIWDPAGGDPVVLEGHEGYVEAVAVGSLAGREVIVSGLDRWDGPDLGPGRWRPGGTRRA